MFNPSPTLNLSSIQNYVLWFFSYGCEPVNNTEYLEAIKQTEERFQDNPRINWSAIYWVQRPLYMWIIQVILAIISLCETILITYLAHKVSIKIFIKNTRIGSFPNMICSIF